MKRTLLICMCALMIACCTTTVFAADFDDTYCDSEFKGEKLWTSDISPKKLTGHSYDTENGVFKYDWVHQIWDGDHEQLYVQEKYAMTVEMKKILEVQGEMLENVSYSFEVASGSDDKLQTQYSSLDDIATPDGYSRMDLKVAGYDAVYIYTESKTPGDGDGVLPYADNHGTIYVPIADAKNQLGKLNTLVIKCGINGSSMDLFDSMLPDYMNTLQALPCSITVDKQEQVFKEGAPAGASSTDAGQKEEKSDKKGDGEKTSEKSSKKEEKANDSGEKKGSAPVVPIVAAAVVVCGAAVAVKGKSGKKPESEKSEKAEKSEKKPESKKGSEPEKSAKESGHDEKPSKTEEEIKHEKYVEKLKEKYGTDDEKELRKEIMEKQIHNEKLGYIAQADMAYADAALDTAEGAKKVADISVDVIAEINGPEGKVAKNIYTGLTEAAEAVGEVIAGRDAASAITEAVVDSSIGIIQNQADGFAQKFAANTIGGGARDFADTYLETDGDLVKAIDAADAAVKSGAAGAVIDGVIDGIADEAAGKVIADAGKKLSEEAVKTGIDAGKTLAQDIIKD